MTPGAFYLNIEVMKRRVKQVKNARLRSKRLSFWLPREQTNNRIIIEGNLERDPSIFKKTKREKLLLKIAKLMARDDKK